jgi:hypothetical protein
MDAYTPRYEGARWTIVYGTYTGIEVVALNELQLIVQACMPYVAAVCPADHFKPAPGAHALLIGTAQNNRWIRELAQGKDVDIPRRREGYALLVRAAPWPKGGRLAVIAGRDAKGVLNGVADFGARVVSQHVAPLIERNAREAFDGLPDLCLCGAPAIENRGIWTWGYVIYNYRRFLDNMARLKMNMLVMWNDCAPLNLRDIVAYAHARGIKIIAGYHWGWGLGGVSLDSRAARKQVKAHVIRHYESGYAGTGIDGIYFQTLTEHHETGNGGRSTAALACDWVNDIAGALFKRYPDLYIQFGLHATSIVEHYADLEPLDERIAIIWEDAGVVPYSSICRETGVGLYAPMLEFPAGSHFAQHGLHTFDGTLAFSKQLAAFRGRAEFGLCPKGFSNLDWGHEFEHHGAFILGERSAEFVRQRCAVKQRMLAAIDQRWAESYPYAARFYREVRAHAAGTMTDVALVEDAAFEEAIPLSVALHAETVWNPDQPDRQLLETAMSGYYRET